MKDFEVSQSKIKLWRRCKKAYDYKINQKLIPRVTRRPLAFGTIVHGMLEAHFNGDDPWSVLKAYEKSQGKLFKAEEEEFGNILDDIQVLMECYFRFYKDDDKRLTAWKNPNTDKRSEHNIKVVMVDLGKRGRIIYDCTIDTVLVDRKLNAWLTDHKTGVREVPSVSRFTDIQSMLYVWAFEKDTGLGVNGVLWNYIKSKAPSVPRILKSGEFSRAASQSTTWFVYRRALKNAGLDPKNYKDMKELLEGREVDFFNRVFLPVKKEVQQQILEEAIDTAQEMKEFSETGPFPRTMDKHCLWCDYQGICNAELQGLDARSVRINDYRKDNGKARSQGAIRRFIHKEED